MANNLSSDDWLKWLVQTNNISKLWADQPTYLISQASFMLGGLVTLVHAFSKGGRWPYYWFGTVLHGLYADNFFHFAMPEYDNFWHSQTPIMFLENRLPLHIILLYPVFMYNAAYAISRLGMSKYAEPFAVGLLTVLIDIPYDIVSVKFVHWTWHDTDPNIYDRHYYVPWNSYYFHATFTASFYYFFHLSRKWFAPQVSQWKAADYSSELKSIAVSALLGMPGGILLFLPIYHPLHDHFGIDSEITFFILFAVYSIFILNGVISIHENVQSKLSIYDHLLILHLIIHYMIFLLFVLFGKPENERSFGVHEPIGPCEEMVSLRNPLGQILYKRKYLCYENYDESYFDFHCVDKMPPQDPNWYLICGTPFENRAEYVTIVTTIVIFAAAIFYLIYFKGARVRGQVTNKKKKNN